MAIVSKTTRKKQLAAKIETTEGTAETLTGSEAGFLPKELEFIDDLEMLKREVHLQVLSQIADIPGARPAMVRFKHEMMGASAAGVAPPIGILLKACGIKETIVADTSVTYTLTSVQSDYKTLTLGVWEDGILQIGRGFMGKCKAVFEAGKLPYWEFDFLGIWNSRADAAAYSNTLPTILPQIFQNAAFEVDGASAFNKASKIEIDFGQDIVLRTDPDSEYGLIHAIQVGREPKVMIDPEAVPVATYDVIAKHGAGTTIQLEWVVGTGTGKTFSFSIPTAQIKSRKMGERDKLMIMDLELSLTGDNDDEFSMVLE